MNRHRLLIVVVAALAAACTKQSTKGEAPAEAKGEALFVFPHAPHLENDVDCKLCHASILTATKLEAKVRHVALSTKPDDCSGCHETVPTLELPVRTADLGLRFDHAAHLKRVKDGDCKTCHKQLPDAKAASYQLAPMETCTGCHNHQRDVAEARCSTCHTDLARYEKPVTTFKHQGDFLKIHGQLARPTAETCAQCHEQTFCADCHSATTVAARPSVLFPEAVQRDFIHRGDFVSRHMVEAGANPASCRKCHGSQFCDSCHTIQNVSPMAGPNARVPHTAGWMQKSSGNFHGDAARRNIVACAGCHDQGRASICVTCHAVGAPAAGNVNPHPSSFKLKASDRSKNSMCLACHPS